MQSTIKCPFVASIIGGGPSEHLQEVFV
ncbi:uncharacterized protein METZ01_LOCUS224182, partial [marine metagenome]